MFKRVYFNRRRRVAVLYLVLDLNLQLAYSVLAYLPGFKLFTAFEFMKD